MSLIFTEKAVCDYTGISRIPQMFFSLFTRPGKLYLRFIPLPGEQDELPADYTGRG